MYAQVEKPKENKSRAVANNLAQPQGIGKSTFQFVDSRSKSILQRKYQEMLNSNPQVNPLNKISAQNDVQCRRGVNKRFKEQYMITAPDPTTVEMVEAILA